MSLTGKKPGESYIDLLQMDNSNSGVDGTLRVVKDGEGTATPLSLSTTAVQVSATPANPNDVANKAYVDNARALLGTLNLAGVSSADTASTLLQDYSLIEVQFMNFVPAVANNGITFQVYIDGTLADGASDYGWTNERVRDGSANAISDHSDSRINLHENTGTDTDATRPSHFFMTINNPAAISAGARAGFIWQGSWVTSSFVYKANGAGIVFQSGQVTGLKVLSSAGDNFTSGLVRIYGSK